MSMQHETKVIVQDVKSVLLSDATLRAECICGWQGKSYRGSFLLPYFEAHSHIVRALNEGADIVFVDEHESSPPIERAIQPIMLPDNSMHDIAAIERAWDESRGDRRESRLDEMSPAFRERFVRFATAIKKNAIDDATCDRIIEALHRVVVDDGFTEHSLPIDDVDARQHMRDAIRRALYT
jgi:hypothetical protein